MNQVVIMGRLVRDPEQRVTQSEKQVSTFTLAVNRRYEKDKADFFNIIAWNKLSEFTQKYLTKGRQIAVSGRLQTRDYEKNGAKVYVTEIIAEEIYFADSKPSDKTEVNVTYEDYDRSTILKEIKNELFERKSRKIILSEQNI